MSQVNVINICDLLDDLYGEGEWINSGYEEISERVIRWCETNRVHYYARPKDSFSVGEAMDEAQKVGLSTVALIYDPRPGEECEDMARIYRCFK